MKHAMNTALFAARLAMEGATMTAGDSSDAGAAAAAAAKPTDASKRAVHFSCIDTRRSMLKATNVVITHATSLFDMRGDA